MSQPPHDAHSHHDHNHEADDGAESRCSTSRRALLTGVATAGAVALAGCQGGSDATGTPQPPADVGDDQCDACGMVIGEHFGPTGQVFYADESPEAHANPARFDSLANCLFPYHFEKEGQGWEATTIYVTDYSSVEYELVERKGKPYISRHTAAESYAEASDVTLVVGSAVHGAMGTDAVPFSRSEDAEAFRDEWGGELLAFADVEPGTFSRS